MISGMEGGGSFVVNPDANGGVPEAIAIAQT